MTRGRTNQITADQLKLIHVAKRELGFDDDMYRDVLMRFGGVQTAKDLTLSAFQGVMAHLETCGFVRRDRSGSRIEDTSFGKYLKKWHKRGHRPNMATAEQLARIETDWDAMHWYWTQDGFGKRNAALRGFLQKRFRVSDLRFLTFGQASGMIEALKGIRSRRG